METGESAPTELLQSAVTELHLSPERSQILNEGLTSARGNKDLLQARLLSSIWTSRKVEPPAEIQELNHSLEQEWESGKVNIKFDTQLEDGTVTDQEEVLFRKIQRCTDQNEKLKNGESRIFAIIVPSYWKEEEGLSPMLSSVGEQRFDDTVIVVISDNNDEDGRKKFDIGQSAKSGGANVAAGSIVANIASARRAGIDRALVSEHLSPTPMILIGTDSDSFIKEGYLQSVREAFRDPRVIASTGPLEYRLDQPEMKAIEGKINSHIKDRTESGFAHLPGANTVVKADVYRHIGGYCLDYKVGEDGNLAQKIRDYLKYEGRQRAERVLYVPDQVVSTSARKYVDDQGNYSEEMNQAYDKPLFREYFLNVAHGENLLEAIVDPRDVSNNIILSQLRKWKDRFNDLRYLLSRDGENRVRNMVRILRTWDNFYQRTNNLPEVRTAILEDTKRSRDNIDTIFQREFKERGLRSSDGTTSVLAGTVVNEMNREVSIFIFKKPTEGGQGSGYLAIEIERDPASENPPIIASLVEIDEGAKEKFTKVLWYPERMLFHPDDDYPRTAALIFNTHYASIDMVPTEQMNVLVGEDEIKQRAKILFSAYANAENMGDRTIGTLKKYISL